MRRLLQLRRRWQPRRLRLLQPDPHELRQSEVLSHPVIIPAVRRPFIYGLQALQAKIYCCRLQGADGHWYRYNQYRRVTVNGQTRTITVTKIDQQTNTPPSPLPQSPTSQTTSTSTSTAARQTHTVQVGALGELIYGPNQLNAALGDIVRLDFLKLNHSVTQSSFAEPCTYNGGFDTGLNQFNPQNISGKFLVDFQVNTTDPLWFYCGLHFIQSITT